MILKIVALSSKYLEEKNSLSKELEYGEEEAYLGQCLRINWLAYGDCNSSSFHTTTMQCGNFNKITKLKNLECNWIEDEF